MLFVTGDTHSNFGRFSAENFSIQKELTKDDYMLICRDFGGIWDRDQESEEEKWWLNWLDNKPYTTLFVDGNHENFDRLCSYREEIWHGGKIHRIRKSVIHLMRGQVFKIDGKKCFTFGGARSHDIKDGILEINEVAKIQAYQRDPFKLFRVRGLSWWDLEMPTEKEMQEGIKNLDKNNWEVDYVFTHCCPSATLMTFGVGMYQTDPLIDYFQNIDEKLNYKKWYFGHYHENRTIDPKHIMLFEKIDLIE